MTCWRRLRDWHDTGVFDQLHRLLLAQLRHADQLDWSRAVTDGSHIRAPKGDKTGASPVDRARPGSKHHLVCDARGIPLAISLTGGNDHDVTQLLPLIDAIPAVGGKRGSGCC
jgi:transposase